MAHLLSRYCRRPLSLAATKHFNGTRMAATVPSVSKNDFTVSFSNHQKNVQITHRSFSSYYGSGGSGGGGGQGSNLNASPSYQVYGENTAFTMKCILPGFRVVGNKTVIVDNKNRRGRLLFEFTPRLPPDERFAWDKAIKFALSAEEVGVLLSRLSNSEPVEFARQTGGSGGPQYGFHNEEMGRGSLQKVFRAFPTEDGSIQLSVDYELDGRGGQDPPNSQESVRSTRWYKKTCLLIYYSHK